MNRAPSPLRLVEQPIDLYTFAEQHQADPDEAYRDAVYAEIKDGLIWLGSGAAAALLLVLYLGGAL